MKSVIVSALAFVILIAFVALLGTAVRAAAEEAGSIEPRALQARVEAGRTPTILDVRTPAEFAQGHIPGATNIPHTELAARLSELDSKREVALYCMVGPRARLGEQTLREAGYERVIHIEGGLAAWQSAGLPVVKSESE